MISRYRALFERPGFARLLCSSMLARLTSGMFSLAILLFVHARTHSFLTAGGAVGAFTLTGALVGPALGALVDRQGQTRVLVPAAAGQAAALAALVLLADAGAPIVATLFMAGVAGAVQPPIAGCTRALWSQVAGPEVESAYALDATTQELIWTLGPLLVGASAVLASPAAGVLACGAVTLAGTLLFASSRLSRDAEGSRGERSRASALSSPGLRALLCTVLLSGVVIGAVEVGLTAFANAHGARLAAAPLLALFSIGSMAGGIAYSARSWQLALAPRYSAMLLAMALAVVPLAAMRSLALAFPLSVLAGLALAPMLTVQFSLVGALASDDTATEAFTWHRAATIGGMAAGSALGGLLIDAHGAASAFALGCSGITLAWALAEAWRRRIDPDDVSETTDVGAPARRRAHRRAAAARSPARSPKRASAAG